jgi:hypothetical protein
MIGVMRELAPRETFLANVLHGSLGEGPAGFP